MELSKKSKFSRGLGISGQLLLAVSFAAVLFAQQIPVRIGLTSAAPSVKTTPKGNAPAPGIPFTGTFTQDTDQREFFFTVQPNVSVVLRTYSYAGGVTSAGATIARGGFDPSLSVFDTYGTLVAANQDGGCGNVAPDAVTSFCWDSYMALQLPAGTYRLVLTQSTNTANGPTLADSFVYFCSAADQAAGNCTQTFTPDPSPGVLPPGFWDESPNQRTGAFALEIIGATTALPPTFTSDSNIPIGTMGHVYPGYTFVAQPPSNYAWTVVSGTLPPGLTLNPATGAVSGTPSTVGSFSFTIQADDGAQSLQEVVVMTVYDPLGISITALPAGMTGQAYGPLTVTASGGSGTFSFSAANLPPGLAITSAGTISGVPLTPGTTNNIVISVFDSVTGFTTSSGPLSILIGPTTLLISGAGNAGEIVLGSPFTRTFTGAGGKPPYVWTAVNLPAGMTMNASSGVLSGSPTLPGVYSFNVTVSDSATPPATVSQLVQLQVFGLAISSALPNASTSTPYSVVFSATGGGLPYSFSSPNAPPGLTLAGAVLGGTPTTPGTFNFTVRIADANGFVSNALVTLIVTGPASPLHLTGLGLPGGPAGVVYSQALQGSGGTFPYTWKITGGALPDGLTLSSTGSVSGTPAKAGAFTFTAQLTDNSGAVVSAVFTIAIESGQLAIPNSLLSDGSLGSDYPAQVLSGTGGVPPYTFRVTGTLPPGLTFVNGQLSGVPTAAGVFGFSVMITDSEAPPVSATLPIQLTIAAATPNLLLSARSLAFVLTTGASGMPAPFSVAVMSNTANQAYSYSAAVSPAVSWLTVTSGTSTPGSIGVSLNSSATALSATSVPLSASIVVTCLAPSACAGKSQSIGVTLTIGTPAPLLTFNSTLVQFSTTPSNTGTLSRPVALQNTGAGTATIQSITAADKWLTVSGSPATLTGGPATFLTFVANPAGLTPGFYRTAVTVLYSGGTASIPVTLAIAQSGVLTLSTAGTQLQSIAGSSPGNAGGSFQLSAGGSSAVNWTATVEPGATWLHLSGAVSGSATGASPSTVTYAIDRAAAAALAAGAYYGTVQISADGVINSPQSFQVVMNVAEAGSPVTPDPQPAGLTFSSGGGTTAPAAQSVTVYSDSAAAVAYSAAATTVSGGSWLSVTPGSGLSGAAAAGVSSVSVNAGTLTPGVYNGSVSYQSSAAAIRTVNVTLVVQAATGCVPAHLALTETGLASNFALPAGWPTAFAVTLMQDCAAAVSGGQVEVAFSNGDAPLELTLVNATTGLYSGTWTPQSTSPQVTATITATAPGLSTSVAEITGQVTGNAVPILTSGGTLHIFDPHVGGTLGQGTVLQIYGTGLSAAAVTAATLPLPVTLGGTSVTMGGLPAPLFYVSATQINAQQPPALLPGNQYEVIVDNNGAISSAGIVQVNAATPGVAAYPSGQVIAQHLDYTLVTEDAPAKPGEYVVIYLAGMGTTNPVVAEGTASPASPLAVPVIAPVLTIDGTSVPITFAGLTPNLVGLFQINFQVPADAANGDRQLVVSQAGVAGNASILPVHN